MKKEKNFIEENSPLERAVIWLHKTLSAFIYIKGVFGGLGFLGMSMSYIAYVHQIITPFAALKMSLYLCGYVRLVGVCMIGASLAGITLNWSCKDPKAPRI